MKKVMKNLHYIIETTPLKSDKKGVRMIKGVCFWMKVKISLLLMAAMLMVLAACGNQQEGAPNQLRSILALCSQMMVLVINHLTIHHLKD